MLQESYYKVTGWTVFYLHYIPSQSLFCGGSVTKYFTAVESSDFLKSVAPWYVVLVMDWRTHTYTLHHYLAGPS